MILFMFFNSFTCLKAVSFFGSTGTKTSSTQTNMKKMEEGEAMFVLLVFGCILRWVCFKKQFGFITRFCHIELQEMKLEASVL